MPRYIKETPRITVKFIDSDTEEVLFEIKDRNWMNVGELLTTQITSNLVIDYMKNRKLPKNIMVIAISECTLEK